MSVVWAVTAVIGTTAHAADEALAQQRADRHAVHAVLRNDVARHPPALGISRGAPSSAGITGPDGEAWTALRESLAR
ncbi:hypothetical protein ACIRQQ_43685 [Streptomyces fuscichromogenes]|uniref:hypothetical protein n=1 Tax=Streptomyces fuscichromogenes TaxID=1324013 RepID=UPI0037F8473D